jgi:hypothetical protein
MFALLRKTITLGVMVGSTILVWETIALPGRLGLSVPRAIATPPEQSPANVSGSPSGRSWAATAPAGQRFLAWALFVLLTPVVTAPLAVRVLGRQSNTGNVLLVLGYTGLSVLAAYVVGGMHVAGIWSAVGYLIALLGVFTYNLLICAFLSRLGETR